jgi:glycosyltransferase involved in cell wall biosynthesis
MKILALPRDRSPYQELLYDEMRKLGACITYLGTLTPSHSLNVLLLPLELVLRRARGARLVHLHWAFAFRFPGASRWWIIRLASQLWFMLWLRTCRLCGMRLIWTAHNVLPHEAVFADDLRARRELVRASDVVVAHSKATLDDLRSIGAPVRRGVVIEHGPIGPDTPEAVLWRPRSDAGVRELLFIGHIRRYKGIDDLVSAFLAIPEDVPVHLTVAGKCSDAEIRRGLDGFAVTAGNRATVRCEYLGEDEITLLLAAADIVVLPFRSVTTSGSAILALSHGRPVIVPSLAAVAELPSAAAIRYDGSVPGLTAAMKNAADADAGTLARMSAAAYAYAHRITWRDVATQTIHVMGPLVGGTEASDRSPEEEQLARWRHVP